MLIPTNAAMAAAPNAYVTFSRTAGPSRAGDVRVVDAFAVSWNERLYTVAAVDRAAPGMILGGILWVVHGVFEMIAPFGAASVYDPTLGYELITDRALYLLYGVPGTVALILSGFGLVTLARGRAGRLVGVGRVLASATLGAGVLGGFGLAIGSAPLVVAPIALGTPVLGAAACFVATGARSPARADRGLLRLTGVLGLFILLLRPLVYALQVISLAVGAAIIGLFGVGVGRAGLAGDARGTTRELGSAACRGDTPGVRKNRDSRRHRRRQDRSGRQQWRAHRVRRG